MGQKKRILHVLYSHIFSGAENVVCQIIEMFRDNPDVEMFYTSPDGTVRPALEERGVNYFPLKHFTLSEIRSVIRQVQPTVIHAHDMRASFAASLCCGNIPLISHIHNNNIDSRGISLKSVLYRFAAARANQIFWVAPAAFNGYRFHKGLESKSTLLLNVIDTQALAQKAENAPAEEPYDIVFLGRLTYQKNPVRLVEVMAAAAKLQPGLRSAIIGDGEMEQEVRAAIERLGCQDSVHLLGFRSNPYGLLKNAKVLLLTSYWEGLPMCALEAMSLGVGVVSTPVDGMLNLVDQGKTGFLSDNTEELAVFCVKLCQEDDLRKACSINAVRKAAELMDYENYRQTMAKAYGIPGYGEKR